MENNKNKKSVKFQVDVLNFCDFIQVFVFTRNHHLKIQVQSTLIISKLKGPSETLRDIRTLTYQIFRIEENTNSTTKFHK